MTDLSQSDRMPGISTVRLPYGGTPEAMLWRSLRATPYAELKDADGTTILTVAMGPKGYVVHLNQATAGWDLDQGTVGMAI